MKRLQIVFLQEMFVLLIQMVCIRHCDQVPQVQYSDVHIIVNLNYLPYSIYVRWHSPAGNDFQSPRL
jgi:hypothetical protein